MMETMLETIITISLSMTPILILMLVLSDRVSRNYRAGWKYWIWLLIALRLVIPIHITFPGAPVIETASLIQYEIPINRNYGSNDYKTSQNTSQEFSESHNILSYSNSDMMSPLQLGTYLYVIGIAFFLIFPMKDYFLFIRKIKRWRRFDDDSLYSHILKRLSSQLRIKRIIPLYQCREIDTPMLVGFLHPAILIPCAEDFTETQMEMILRHELIHYQRKDIWYKLLLLAANALHWFNPFVYVATKQAIYDMESSCDEEVIRSYPLESRIQYGEAMLSAMRYKKRHQVIVSTYFSAGKNRQKKRFENIINFENKHKGIRFFVVLTICVLTATFFIQFRQKKRSLSTTKAIHSQEKQKYMRKIALF